MILRQGGLDGETVSRGDVRFIQRYTRCVGAFRFDCVFYYVTDLDRAIAFYTDVLGFRLSSRDAVARFVVDGMLVELVPAADRGVIGGRGNARLTLAADDIEAAVEDLRARGVPVSAVRAVSNGRLAQFEDPDGNELVLWQYA